MSKKGIDMINCGDASSTIEEPLSPGARLFYEPSLEVYVVGVLGWKTSIDPSVFKAGLQQTLVQHPRFSSTVVVDEKSGRKRWVPTAVNIEDHVIVPKLDANIASPDEFIEDYVSNLTREPLDKSRPLWEVHLLNVKTSDAESVAVFKIHHSIGDGASLSSLVLACCRKTTDPEALPTIPVKKRRSSSQLGGFSWIFMVTWTFFRMILNSFVDVMLLIATGIFLKDTKSPIKGGPGVELTPKRFVHRALSLEDLKIIKDAMNMTINDVLLGVTQAALSQYLSRRYATDDKKNNGDKDKANLSGTIRIRAAVFRNLRPAVGIQALSEMMAKKSTNKWGNKIGYVLIPFKIATKKDPLQYLHTAKATMDRKKCSLESHFTSLGASLLRKTFGDKAVVGLTHDILLNTTMTYSNVVGPQEEVSFSGYPMAYAAASVYGLPHALTIHSQSYIDKMIITLAVDPDVIPDPHRLCDDLEESLKLIKSEVLKENIK